MPKPERDLWIDADAAAEQVKLGALNRDVGLALIQSDTLPDMLRNCAESMIRHLDGAFARIWTLNAAENMLELQASAGMYTHLDGPHGRIPVGKFKIGLIAQERKPHLTNDVVGDPRVNQQDWAKREGMVAFAGYPLVVDERVIGVMAMFARHPFTQATLEAMASVANAIAVGIERKTSEEQRRKHQEWLSVMLASKSAILDTALDCIITMDHEGNVVEFNPAAEKTFGYDRAGVVGQPLVDLIIPPSLRERHKKGMAHYLATGEGPVLGKRLELPAMRADGREFPVELAITRIAVDGPPLFTAYLRDISERKQAETALRESEGKLRLLADTIPQLAWMARADGHILWYNRRWYEYTGKTAEEMEGWGWQSVHDPKMLPKVLERWNASIASGAPFDMVFPLRGADGQFRPFLTRINPVKNEQGETLYWFGTNTDISEQQRVSETSQFLSEASAILANVVDYKSTLGKVAQLAVPYFADGCSVDVVADNGLLERLAAVHNDPAKLLLADELHRRYPERPDDPIGPQHVLQTGQSEMVSELTDDILFALARDGDHLRLLREMQSRSCISVPLVVRSKTLGVITFMSSDAQRRYGPAELNLAQDLADRASIAIDNSLLYQQLHDADRRKDEFLATLAHELRNPLAPICNALQILKMSRSGMAADPQITEMMERQVAQLVRLVDDLLDVSRIMRGKIELRKERVELASVIARALEMMQPLVAAQGHVLTVVMPSQSLPISADPLRLTQVVGNLLSNAVKYTERNGRIRLTAERGDNEIILRIHDNGIGIAPDMLPHVFDLFVQADHTATRSQGGLGIGLTLVKSLVELHLGTIEAHSAGLGKGSEFVIRLPILAEGEIRPVAKEVHNQQPDESFSGQRLLVVDDNRDAAISLATLLRMKGHDVRIAHDGPSALALAGTYRPALIFLDIGMPGMDGYEVARQVRLMPELRNCVLAALTGWGQEEDRRRSAQAGFDRHLVKPPEARAVNELLAELEQRNNAASTVRRRILLVEDNAVASKILSMLIHKLGPHEIEVALEGLSAIEKAKVFRPEIILLDIGLPTIDGYEVARRLRQHEAGADVLLVALTGYQRDEDRKKSSEAGFDEHLVKPVDIEMLRHLLSHPKLDRAKR